MPPLTDPLKQKQEFFAINGLRFLAALWVLLFHASIHFGSIDELYWIQPVLNQGTLAMTLFFMLSGFILSYRYSTFSKPDDMPNYFAARVARLYPVYVFMGITTLWQLSYGASQFWIVDRYGYLGAAPFALFAIFLFVFAAQAWFPSLFMIWNFNGSWSLSVEAFFYTLFPRLRKYIGCLGDRSLIVLVFLLPFIIFCISLGLLFSYRTENNTAQIFYILPIFRLPEFLLGICGYVLFVERG
jgi:peptidoglycan/LPS O-acetylase OafA/YrhL